MSVLAAELEVPTAPLITDARASLAEHRFTYPPPTSGAGLIGLVAAAGLQGRGGAGFPTARKLAAVAERPGPRVVVANGTEGEPASSKDSLLMRRSPHLVLDGALLAAAAVGAQRVVVCIDRDQGGALTTMRHALDERSQELRRGPLVEVAGTPPWYVAGEETALVHWLNGGPAKPTLTPPRPFERGVDGLPTLVQNVETLAHVARIARFGADWFGSQGADGEPGTRLHSVTGAVIRPGVIEAETGTPVRTLIELAGGAAEPLSALLVGGYFGVWVDADEAVAAPYSRAGLAPLGAAPGAGILVALAEGECGLSYTARLMSWYAGQSARQCGPCQFGLAAIARTTESIARGAASPAHLRRLERWAGDVEGRGACRHPDGGVRLLRSALRVFAGDLERHLSGRPCASAR
jgi:NADH:ubiquinone oxidoreductase subunit F (NADH-binding)